MRGDYMASLCTNAGFRLVCAKSEHLGLRQAPAAFTSQRAGVTAEGHDAKREGFAYAEADRLGKPWRRSRQQGYLQKAAAGFRSPR